MNIRNKVIAVVVGILLIISLIVGGSYAYFMHVEEIEDKVMASSDCFEITFEGDNELNLVNAVPTRLENVDKLEPYTFTIKNVCNHAMNYDVNIETLSGSTIDSSDVYYRIDNQLYSSFEFIKNTSGFVNPDAIDSTTLTVGVLNPNEEKTHNVRIWIKNESTAEDTAGKVYYSKIAIVASLNRNSSTAVLTYGSDFNAKINSLIPVDGAYETLEVVDEAPGDDVEKINVSVSDDTPIYAWYDTDRVKIYSSKGGITLNPNSDNMFYESKVKYLDLRKFDTSLVTSMIQMFYGMKNIESLNLSTFNTKRVRYMNSMFYNVENLEELDLSSFDTRNVTRMDYMFDSYSNSNLKRIKLGNFSNEKVTKMNYMFAGLEKLESLDLSTFYTPNVDDMQYMFDYCSSLKELDLSTFDTSNVTNMYRLFYMDTSLKKVNVSSFDTRNVKYFNKVFKYTGLETLDISNFEISPDAYVSEMFWDSVNLKTIYVKKDWNLNENYSVFSYNDSLVGGAGTSYADNTDYSNRYSSKYAIIDDPENGRPGYFTLKED